MHGLVALVGHGDELVHVAVAVGLLLVVGELGDRRR